MYYMHRHQIHIMITYGNVICADLKLVLRPLPYSVTQRDSNVLRISSFSNCLYGSHLALSTFKVLPRKLGVSLEMSVDLVWQFILDLLDQDMHFAFCRINALVSIG
jgi:hypothetical protein